MVTQQDTAQQLPVRAANGSPPAFGGALKSEFLFDPEWRNLNHGSFGTYPRAIQAKMRGYQDAAEARPDIFIRYQYPGLLDKSREAVASVVNAPVDSCVFVSNATEGVNTVFRNLVWNDDGKDIVVVFSTAYEACVKAAAFVGDYTGKLAIHKIALEYPVEDAEIERRFRAAVTQLKAEGKRPRIAMFDVISSRPGVVVPWEALVRACRELDMLSLVDGAQGIGMVKLDLAAADPDFFVSNCHKWLFAPRGCAVLYVPERNQALLPSTLATSHGYLPRGGDLHSPLPPRVLPASRFASNFQFVGTKDDAPYLCVADAVAWRRDVLGGEDKIRAYLWGLNKEGSDLVARELGTPVMENSTGTMRNCAMANIALPVWVGAKGPGAGESDTVVPAEHEGKAFQWICRTMVDDYKTFMALVVHGGRFWIRISAQVYLDLEDYKWAAETLKKVCARVAKQEYL